MSSSTVSGEVIAGIVVESTAIVTGIVACVIQLGLIVRSCVVVLPGIVDIACIREIIASIIGAIIRTGIWRRIIVIVDHSLLYGSTAHKSCTAEAAQTPIARMGEQRPNAFEG